MNEPIDAVARILVIHPEADVRRTVEKLLRQVTEGAMTVYEAASLGGGLEAARRLAPSIILMDLSSDRHLALEVANDSRRPDRLLVGLYNPLLVADGQAARFFRDASRAGIDDFVPMPPGEAELRAVLANAPDDLVSVEAPSEGRLVAFLGPKGGVGVTTVAVNTGLVAAGSQTVSGGVAFCDAGLPFGTAAALMGLAPNRDLSDLVRDLDDLKALGTYLTPEERTHLAVLAGPRDPYDAQAITPEQLSRVLIQLRRRFARVIVDSPPTLDLLALAAVDLAEILYVVTEASAPTVVVTARFLRLLEDQGLGGERLRLILNRYQDKESLPVDLVAEQLDHQPDYVVPFGPEVARGANRGEPAVLGHPDSPFSEAIGEIAEEVALAERQEH